MHCLRLPHPWLATLVLLGSSSTGAPPVELALRGDWTIEVTRQGAPRDTRPGGAPARLDVARPPVIVVTDEKLDPFPIFDRSQPFWRRGVRLTGVRTQETSACGALDPASLEIRARPGTDAPAFVPGKDYDLDPEWGTVGRLAGGAIAEGRPVYARYRHGLARLDSIVLEETGRIALRSGLPHVTAPRPPAIAPGEVRLANVWIPARLARLGPDNLFPILDPAYPEPARTDPPPAARLLPKTYAKLLAGDLIKVLAWGDSVTVGTFVPEPDRDRWQCQFAARLRQRFPRARIDLVTEAWGGRSTGSYLAEPPGAEHNYAEKVLGARPDLLISEFVNDAGLSAAGVATRYGRILADLRAIGAEWIILTPHYTLPSMMGFTRQRDIDHDPRPYVAALREFAPRNKVALADASLRWGRLWRQGIPYMTLMLNSINHPDERGMALFADSLLTLF